MSSQLIGLTVISITISVWFSNMLYANSMQWQFHWIEKFSFSFWIGICIGLKCIQRIIWLKVFIESFVFELNFILCLSWYQIANINFLFRKSKLLMCRCFCLMKTRINNVEMKWLKWNHHFILSFEFHLIRLEIKINFHLIILSSNTNRNINTCNWIAIFKINFFSFTFTIRWINGVDIWLNF